MDPRQRSADQRRFMKIGVFIVVGLGFIGFTAALMALGVGDNRGRRSYPVELGIVFGLGWIGVGLFDLMRRVVTGPTKPGRRARF